MALVVPHGKRGGETMEFRIPEQVAKAATCAVKIPPGAAPRSKFSVMVAGRTLELTVPPHLKPGKTLRFMLGPELKLPQPRAAATAAASLPSSSAVAEWSCPACTFKNGALAPVCAMCSTTRMDNTATSAKGGKGKGGPPPSMRAPRSRGEASQPPIAEAVHAAPPRMLTADVQVPPGVGPGGAFNIDTGGGKLMRVVVPASVRSGQTIRVQYPAPEEEDTVIVDGMLL